MTASKIAIVGVLALAVAACTKPEPEIQIRTVEVERPRLNIIPPQKPRLSDVEFKLITPNTQAKLLRENRLFYGLTENGFETHIDNMERLLRHQRALEATNDALINYYENRGEKPESPDVRFDADE